ncbi:MAG: hypothetical protein WCX79_03785 [Candidatus Paceibacterota bacterium]|jgi:hypothetical protein
MENEKIRMNREIPIRDSSSRYINYEGLEPWRSALKNSSIGKEIGKFDSLMVEKTVGSSFKGYKLIYKNQLINGENVNVYIKEDNKEKWKAVFLHLINK